MLNYHELLNDILILQKAGLTSLLRIKYFLEIMRDGQYIPIEHHPDNHGYVTAQCRLLALGTDKHKALVNVEKPSWPTAGRLVYTPNVEGKKLYAELSSGLEKFVSTLESIGMRNLNDIAIFLFVSNGKITITELHDRGFSLGLYETVNVVNKTINLGMAKNLQRSAAFDVCLFSKKTHFGNRSSEVELTAAGRRLFRRATGG